MHLKFTLGSLPHTEESSQHEPDTESLDYLNDRLDCGNPDTEGKSKTVVDGHKLKLWIGIQTFHSLCVELHKLAVEECEVKVDPKRLHG